MRHYEIVLLIHPDQSEQIHLMVDKYKKIILDNKGVIHRFEDCGRKHLAYPIDKIHKAHYLLMNIEIDNAILDELNHIFKFNDAVIRNLIITKNHAVTTPSVFMKDEKAKSLI